MPQKTPANSTSRRAQHDEQSVEQIKADRDHYHKVCQKAQEKLDAAHQATRDTRAENKRLQEQAAKDKDEIEKLRKAFKQIKYENEQIEYDSKRMEKKYVGLQASYDNLLLKYKAIPEERSNPMVAALPERTRRSPASASSGSNSGVPPPSMSSAARAQQEEAERGRRRQADKDRLGARFDSAATTTINGGGNKKRPPLTHDNNNNRHSYIEGFGRSRPRSGSAAAPSSRDMFHHAVQTGRYAEPLTSAREAVVFSTVPRRMPSRSGYGSGGSSTAVFDDYDEDGDYHLLPIR